MDRYVKCECGNVVRYKKELTGERCSRCGRQLVNGNAVGIGVWLRANGIEWAKNDEEVICAELF